MDASSLWAGITTRKVLFLSADLAVSDAGDCAVEDLLRFLRLNNRKAIRPVKGKQAKTKMRSVS
jgi:hypothetical protein